MPVLRRPAASHATRAFSLLEMMLVLLIMATLATIVVVNLTGRSEKAKRDVTVIKMKQVEDGLKAFRFNEGRYPTLEEGLGVLVQGKYLDSIPKDGWNHPFAFYLYPDDPDHPYVIISYGPDGQPNTPDDINNWNPQQ